MQNSNKPIATINGVDIKTDAELLNLFAEELPYTEYIEVDNIDDVSDLEYSKSLIDEYIYHLQDLVEHLNNRIEEIENNEE
jgi:hypothetical protein